MLGMETYEEIMEPIERARQACLTMGIPEEQHFKQIYRFSSLSMSLRPDYQLTPLATYLVTVNGNPANVNVAKAQVFFFLKFTC
jgi:DNA-damage-inducible protein D